MTVGTVKKSMAAISPMWRFRNERHIGDGVLPPRAIYCATTDSATEYPSSPRSLSEYPDFSRSDYERCKIQA